MSFKQQQPLDVWSRESPSLQSSMTRPLSLCDQCNYPEEASEWLLWDAVTIGLDLERHTSSAVRRVHPQTQPSHWNCSELGDHIKSMWATCDQGFTVAQVGQQSTNSMEMEEEPALSTSHNKGRKREVPLTRNRGNPRRNSVVAVEHGHHIQEVSVQQRKPHVQMQQRRTLQQCMQIQEQEC